MGFAGGGESQSRTLPAPRAPRAGKANEPGVRRARSRRGARTVRVKRLLIRGAVVDDPGCDQDNEVTPVFRIAGEAEQLADDRQAAQERDARAGLGAPAVTVRPPMTAVSPSLTRSWLSAFCFGKMKPRSAAASGWIAERSVWSCISIWRLLVTCGVTVSRIPVSLNCTLARAVPAGAAAEWRR